MTTKKEPQEPIVGPVEPETPQPPVVEPIVEPSEVEKPKVELTDDIKKLISQTITEARKQEQEEYRARQRKWTREDKKRKQESQRERPQDLSSISKALVEAVKAAGGDPGQVEQITADINKQAEFERARADWDTKVEDKRDDIRNRLYEAELDPDDDNLIPIWESFDIASTSTGNFNRADQRVDAAIRKAQKAKETEVESKEKPQEKPMMTEAEILAYIKEVKGIDLKPDIGSSSAGKGRTYTREEIKDPAFYSANKEDILKAQEEGRIE